MTFAGKESKLFTGSNRFDRHDIRYKLADNDLKDIPITVIIEEAFILTEEMYGALTQKEINLKRKRIGDWACCIALFVALNQR